MKGLTIIFLLLFSAFFAKAQSYIPFPVDSAQWCITLCEQHEEGGMCHDHTLLFEPGTDTVVHGINYKNINLTRTKFVICCDGWGNYFNLDVEDEFLGALGGMRIDNRKVYFYRYLLSLPFGLSLKGLDLPDTTEVLLYDFGLQPGDTFYIADPGVPDYIVLDEIDSVLLQDGKYHHSYLFIGGDNWLEGVGTEADGLFGSYITEALNGYDWSWFTFLQNGAVIYSELESGDCEMGGINSVKNIETSLTMNTLIFEQLNINSPIFSGGDYEIAICSMTGQQLLSWKLTGENQIQMDNLAAGCYIAIVSKGTEIIFTQKVVKIN